MRVLAGYACGRGTGLVVSSTGAATGGQTEFHTDSLLIRYREEIISF